MYDPDDEDLDLLPGTFDCELYDTSDVTFTIKQNKAQNEIALIAKCSATSKFNLVKYYLSLREYVDKIESELGIMSETDGEH
jgi:hypothetical protein